MRKVTVEGREIEILDKADLTGNILKVRFKDTDEVKNIHSKFIKVIKVEEEKSVKDEVELEMAELNVEISRLVVKAKKIETKCKKDGIFGVMLSFDDILKMNIEITDIMVKQHKLLEKAAENLK